MSRAADMRADEHTMRETVRCAKQLNVAVGAHPGYPDRDNFGRIESPMAPAEIEASVRDQIAALAEVADRWASVWCTASRTARCITPPTRTAEIAAAIGRAVLESDEQLIMVGQAGSSTLTLWESMGLSCAAEAFADRAYEPDGILRNRTLPGALLDDPAGLRSRRWTSPPEHIVVTTNGSELKSKPIRSAFIPTRRAASRSRAR